MTAKRRRKARPEFNFGVFLHRIVRAARAFLTAVRTAGPNPGPAPTPTRSPWPRCPSCHRTVASLCDDCETCPPCCPGHDTDADTDDTPTLGSRP
ncbi:hypothetical protein [Pseudonocardia sp. WMMC193]|uniref:hypothetical protein n=1 Tax=Pseudonocardia sp. WMMC193 TaxID=2911965 RepID=UPI001F25BF42|nr:hypothetical protein [Pseudonocardia sp. WMMC193]MCF7548921.1 hypothetical protein [Pseudonocardia sp. WMMC193]